MAAPELVIIDGAAGLEKAIAALWNDVPVQRCTVHKHRNLLAHAPKKLYDEISADYADMIYAETAKEVEAKRKAFLRKWRLRCRPVADSLEEAGEKLFTFLRFPSDQWEIHPDHQRHRAAARGVQAAHQDLMHAALRGYCLHAVLGVVGQRADHAAQSRWLEDPECRPCRANS